MRIQTKAANITLTPEIHAYLEKRLNQFNKLVERAQEVVAEVELGKTTQHHRSGDVFRTEINLTVAGKFYRAVSETSDLYASIDDAKDEIVREIKAARGKQRTLMRRGAGKVKDFIKKFYR